MMHLELGSTYIDVIEGEKVLEIGDTIPISEFPGFPGEKLARFLIRKRV
jgi:hypothetical protein